MDDYIFKSYVDSSREVVEDTTVLRIYSYPPDGLEAIQELPLRLCDFDDCLSAKGSFANPPDLPIFQMILQNNAVHPDTFAPAVISLPKASYSNMIKEFRLPYRSIEGSSTVGPFFWFGLDPQSILHIIYRKSDVVKNGRTPGWELSLSHDLSTGFTRAYCKGTKDSAIPESIKHLKAAQQQSGHPMLLPLIIFSRYHSDRIEIMQREAREWVRKISRVLSFRQKPENVGPVEDQKAYLDRDGLIDFDHINRDLTECHNKVLWNSPTAYLRVVEGFEDAMKLYKENREIFTAVRSRAEWRSTTQNTHNSIASRIQFYKKKLEGQEYFQSITLQRIEILRSSLSISCTQIDNRVSFQLASAQTKLAYSSRREAASQKTIAVLGTVFLPSALTSSIFSMTFFNWQSGAEGGTSHVSPLFWIYWVVSIPLTIVVVGSYWAWDHKQTLKADKENEEIELQMVAMKRQSQNQAGRSGVVGFAETAPMVPYRKEAEASVVGIA